MKGHHSHIYRLEQREREQEESKGGERKGIRTTVPQLSKKKKKSPTLLHSKGKGEFYFTVREKKWKNG